MTDSAKSLAYLGHNIRQKFEQIDQLQRSPSYTLSLQKFHKGSKISGADWNYEAERFGLWANNLGLYHLAHSSLDYRLREAESLYNLIRNLLKDLLESVSECELISISCMRMN